MRLCTSIYLILSFSVCLVVVMVPYFGSDAFQTDIVRIRMDRTNLGKAVPTKVSISLAKNTYLSPRPRFASSLLSAQGKAAVEEDNSFDEQKGERFDMIRHQQLNAHSTFIRMDDENRYMSLSTSKDNFDIQTMMTSPAILSMVTTTGAVLVASLIVLQQPDSAMAAGGGGLSLISTGSFNPDTFRPVCPASDNVYRFLQLTTQSVVGDDSFVQYGPLIAEGLLRIRLELCVVESYFNEAVGPFIQREGLSWVLPLHETVETFLAGTIFSLATTFILVGSTKIISVLATYADFLVGSPCRLFGGFAYDRARGRPVTLDIGFGPFKTRLVGPGSPKEEEMMKRKKFIEGTNILDEVKEELDWSKVDPKALPIVVLSGGLKLFGETSKVAADILKGVDFFIGRYLTLIATGYIGIKFLHFKVFPDFPPF